MIQLGVVQLFILGVRGDHIEGATAVLFAGFPRAGSRRLRLVSCGIRRGPRFAVLCATERRSSRR